MQELIQRVLAAKPDFVELTRIEIAKLRAHLGIRRRVPLSEMGNDPGYADKQFLRAALRFNEERLALASALPSNVAPAAPAIRPDGFYVPRTIVWRGREHDCELSKREAAFIAVALREREIPLGRVMNRRDGLIWKARYINDRAHRDKVSTFLQRLNKKLTDAKPPLGVFFSLRRGLDFITHSDAPLPYAEHSPTA